MELENAARVCNYSGGFLFSISQRWPSGHPGFPAWLCRRARNAQRRAIFYPRDRAPLLEGKHAGLLIFDLCGRYACCSFRLAHATAGTRWPDVRTRRLDYGNSIYGSAVTALRLVFRVADSVLVPCSVSTGLLFNAREFRSLLDLAWRRA